MNASVGLARLRRLSDRPPAVLIAQGRTQGIWTDRTVVAFAQELVQRDPGRVLFVDNGIPVDAGRVFELARRLAGYFRHRGIGIGDVISFQLPNWWEANVINLAAVMVGAVVNPIVPINRDREVTFILGEARPKIMFAPDEFRGYSYAEMMRRVMPNLDAPISFATLRSEATDGSFEEMVAWHDPIEQFADVDPDDAKLLMYTSGTTGRPKGVVHTHNTINADNAKMAQALHLNDGDSLFTASPVTHVTGYLYALNMPWYRNVQAVTTDTWNPAEALELIERYGCRFMAGATPFLRDLTDRLVAQQRTLSCMKTYICGGASVPASLIYEAADAMPNCVIGRIYGTTEVPTLTTIPETREDIALGAETDGRVYMADVKILDLATGRPVEAGVEGEIVAREASMALGYVHDDDNLASYDEDGFFRTGDLGRFVHGDHLVITGRIKDIIVRSGENISAREIEDALCASSIVQDAAVVAMPSDRTGELACAFVVPAEGAVVTMAEITKVIRDAGLAKQKTPEHLEVVSDIPKNAAGKVLKAQLRERAVRIADEQKAESP